MSVDEAAVYAAGYLDVKVPSGFPVPAREPGSLPAFREINGNARSGSDMRDHLICGQLE